MNLCVYSNKSLKDIHTKVTFTTPNNTTIVSESVTTETKVVTNDTPTESAPINPDKYCPACGGGLTKDATVCSHCGAPLD